MRLFGFQITDRARIPSMNALARLFVMLLVIVAGVALAPRPALAGLTGMQVTSSNNSGTKVCPVTVNYAAQITGTPAQGFVFVTKVTLNGNQSVTATNQVLPASGTMSVPFSFSVTKSGGVNTVEIDVQPLGQQNGALTYPASPFTITCLMVPMMPLATPSPAPVIGSATLTGDDSQLSCPGSLQTTITALGTPNAPFQYAVDTVFGGFTDHYIPATPFSEPSNGQFSTTIPIGIPQMSGSGNYILLTLSHVGTNAVIATRKLDVACQPIRVVDVSPVTASGGLWRPHSDIHYADEDLRFAVRLGLPGPATGAPNCNYVVQLRNGQGTVTSTGSESSEPSTPYQAGGNWFVNTVADVGLPPQSGVFGVTVTGAPSGSGEPACGPQVSSMSMNIYPATAWVTGFELRGFGYHFAGGTSGDAVSGWYCQNCDSIFSPGHDRGWLGFKPTMAGSTLAKFARPGGPANVCGYNITFNGGSFVGNNFMNLNQPNEIQYQNGQPSVPALDASWVLGNNPWWTEWDGSGQSDTVHASVTVSVSGDPLIPACNILDANSLTKNITFSATGGSTPVQI